MSKSKEANIVLEDGVYDVKYCREIKVYIHANTADTSVAAHTGSIQYQHPLDPHNYLAIILASQVKTCGKFTFQKVLTNNTDTLRMEMVAGFNTMLFISKCNPSSPSYDCTMNEHLCVGQ